MDFPLVTNRSVFSSPGSGKPVESKSLTYRTVVKFWFANIPVGHIIRKMNWTKLKVGHTEKNRRYENVATYFNIDAGSY